MTAPLDGRRPIQMLSEAMLRFTVRTRPQSTNNLYGTGRTGKRFKKSTLDGYTTLIVNTALEAADFFGWQLAYDGCARVTIVDWRATPSGLDWDNIPKALQDALCPQIIRNDRKVWEGRVLIARDAEDPRLVVTVEAVDESAIRAAAMAYSLDPRDRQEVA